MSHVTGVPAFSAPVGSCVLYSTLTLAKANETDSVGVSSPPDAPAHWTDSTITLSNQQVRTESCPPAVPVCLRIETIICLRCCPVQHAWKSLGEAMSVFFIMLNDEMLTRDAEMPLLPGPIVTGADAPHENEYISIFFSNFSAVASPGMSVSST